MSEADNHNAKTPAQPADPTQQSVADQAETEAVTAKPSAAPALPEGEISFAELFALAEKEAAQRKAQSSKSQGNKRNDGDLYAGHVLEAKVIGFSHDSVFFAVDGQREGVAPKADFETEDGQFELHEGDTVEVRVLSTDGASLKLGKVLAHQSVKNREALREAVESGLPVEGKITGQNKGGFDVSLGGLRAFLPASQVDTRPVDNAAALIGQKFAFRITEYKDNGRNIVVSRRAILAEERKKKAEEALTRIEEGLETRGVVTSVKDYGAFVDLDGIEGLVHVSEISHGRVAKANDALKPGDVVVVKILKIEDKKGGKKISLSMKALEEDPWEIARTKFKEGAKVMGRVVRIQPFGAFVELIPGVEALIHVSNMSLENVRDPGKVVAVGDEVEATVVSTEWGKRRIGLSLVKTRQELAKELNQGQVHEGVIERIETFGLFVKLPTGARGLVPAPETGKPRGVDLAKEFKAGETVKVSVIDVEKKTGKIRLSIRRASEAEERAEYSQYMGKNQEKKGFNSLGDLLKDYKAKLEQANK